MQYKLIIPLFCIMLTACIRPDCETQIQKADSLIVELRNKQFELFTLDSVLLDSISLKTSQHINQIKALYKNDTLDMNDAHIITVYKNLRLVSEDGRKNRAVLSGQNMIITKQLEKLKGKMEEGGLNRDSATFYLDLESEATRILFDTYQEYTNWYKNAVDSYDSLAPKVDSMITRKRNQPV